MAQETVTVACKLPNGLICRLFAGREENELVMGGGSRPVIRYHPTGEQFVLNGVASEVRHLPPARLGNGMPGPGNVELLESGFALTPNVPKDLWDRWYEANKTADYVRNGLVFAHKQGASIRKQARDHEALTSGFEPIDPEAPAADIEPTDEQKKRLRANRLKA